MVSRAFLRFYVCQLIIFLSCGSNMIMRVERGVYLGHYGILKVPLPSIFLCADLCLTIDECLSVTFDNKLKICKLNSVDWDVNTLGTGLDFFYASKSQMPKTLTTEESSFSSESTPFFACTDSLVDDSLCEKRANIGSCLQSNIGKNLSSSYYLSQNDWGWYQTQCKRSCKLCP